MAPAAGWGAPMVARMPVHRRPGPEYTYAAGTAGGQGADRAGEGPAGVLDVA